MRTYFKKTDYKLEKIWFDYLGIRHTGKGVLHWKPDEGFHLEAMVERSGPLPDRIEFGRAGPVSSQHMTQIKMKTGANTLAVSPSLPLVDRWDLIEEKRLSLNLDQVTFFESFGRESENWEGSALFDTGGDLTLPDIVDREVKIRGQVVEQGYSSSGLFHEEPGMKIIGRMVDKKTLELHWVLPRSKWSRNQALGFCEAFRDALSMETGRTIGLLQSAAACGQERRITIATKRPVRFLRYMSPFYNEAHLNRARLIKLAEFLTGTSRAAQMSKSMFDQIVEASRQQNWQARELLLSTILEAALRTWGGTPFVPRDRTFRFKESLERFREEYFSEEWEESCDLAFRSHINLRDRNAHPDWLTGHGGSLSHEKTTEAFDDMVRLCWFYGYMILALAGFEELKPKFPKPHKEWPALMTRTTV